MPQFRIAAALLGVVVETPWRDLVRIRVLTAGAVGVALLVAGCGGGTPAGSGSTPSAAPEPRTLTVSAAASLTGVFTELEKGFETDNPGVDVKMNFGPSSDLSSQIVAGAPADVFASANQAQMRKVTDAGLAKGQPQVFVTNQLQIAVAPGNPKGIQGFAGLLQPGVILVVCAPQVPCGVATEMVEKATGVTLTPVSEEPDVRSVLSKVTSGNADAGLVYVTDVRSADDQVDGVDFPESAQAINDYPIAALRNAQQAELATKFVELVRSDDAKLVLQTAGFTTP